MQLSIDYAARLERLRIHLPQGIPSLSAVDFQQRSHDLMQRSQERQELARLFARSPCLPLCLPQMSVDDYGMVLDAMFSPAMGKSYTEAHSGTQFVNDRQGQMSYQVCIAPESRHDQLVLRMKQSPVVGLFFPKLFRSRPVNFSRKRMARLPDDCLLGGGIDTMIGMLMYPDVMGPDQLGTPTYFMSALRWRDETLVPMLQTHHDGMSLYVCSDYDELGLSFTGVLILEEGIH